MVQLYKGCKQEENLYGGVHHNDLAMGSLRLAPIKIVKMLYMQAKSSFGLPIYK